MDKRKEIWLEAGYSEFAKNGPDSLVVDKLASLMNKSRSSFYHLFGDLQKYKVELLDYHWEQSKIFALALDNAKLFYPDFAYLLEQNREWTFSHMQTFHNRDKHIKYQEMFDKVTEMIEPRIGQLWAQTAGLDELPIEKTKYLYRVIRETIFSRINYQNYSAELLDKEISELNKSLQFLVSGVKSK